ncbi:type II secretion system protein [Candidatus Roizmanbacteria bacterium]|nr:MAG: type II secretion system protein [Candidatus Roizmanbacteria bacterium]
MLKLRNNKGFTLIELLVVIGILAVLLAITLIAVNPGQQLQQADDTKRRSDINAILNAVNQYMVANNGQVPGTMAATPAAISNTGVDLCTLLVPTYIAALPQDPASNQGADITDCTAYDTGYEASAENNRVTIYAPDANGGTIQVTR